MRVLDPGHLYELRCLIGDTRITGVNFAHTVLRFVKRDHPPEKYPGNVGFYDGTTTQEVLRALIDRMIYVDQQGPCADNKDALSALRTALRLLEERAARERGHTPPRNINAVEIEREPTCPHCGHIDCRLHSTPKPKLLTREQIECCRHIGRDEAARSKTIGLTELDALCDTALAGAADLAEVSKEDRRPEEMGNSELLHRLWTKAVGTPAYVKAEWRELARRFGV